MKNAPVKFDRLLEPLLSETNDEKADELLLQLITVHAGPVIKGVIRYKLRLTRYRTTEHVDADDISQDVILQLLAQLQRFRKLPAENPITDVRGMAAIIAHRTCSRWLRRQFPERHALKNRLHYLLTRQRGFALWQDENGKQVAGFALWQNQRVIQARALLEGDALAEQIRMLKSGSQHDLAEAVATIFNQVRGPIEFDELVGTLATLMGISEQPIESLAEAEDALAFIADAANPNPAWQIEKRIFLQRLWEELQQLPLNQRAALLLNLKYANGFGCITLFPATGIATVRELAESLGMTANAFAQLWNDLPFEDARIAELIGLSRQQVINARKAGRERLARRLKGFI